MENRIWYRYNCKTQIRQAFWLIQFNLTIKTEYRKMKMEKNEFGNKTGFIGPYEKGKGKKRKLFSEFFVK